MKKRLQQRSSFKKLDEERTLLSNERTMLSYIRTAFAALVFGFALLQFRSDSARLHTIGFATIGLGVFFLIGGIIHFSLMKQRIKHEVGDD